MTYQRNPNLRYRRRKNPLPFAWSWCTGEVGDGSGTVNPEPAWVKTQLEAGKRIIPSIELSRLFIESSWATRGAYAQPGFEAARDSGLPVIFVANNVFGDMQSFSEFTALANDPNSPNDHAYMVKDNGVDPLSTSSLISAYAYRLGEWCERFGYAYGTCDIVTNGMAIYPTPPSVILFDNNETGFNWDVQESLGFYDTRENSMINSLKNWYVANYDGDRTTLEGKFAYQFWEQIRDRVWDEAEQYMKYRFQVGFYNGLYENSPEWASVAFYSNYREFDGLWVQGYQVWDTNSLEPLPLPNFSDRVGITGDNKALGLGGGTGECYFNSTWGSYAGRSGVWSISAIQQWRKRFREFRFGGLLPHSICLTWEGDNYPLITDATTPPPASTIWKNYVTMTAWIGRCDLVGYWSSSNSTISSDAFSVYYPVVQEVCEDAAKNTLIDFWQYGKLVESIEGMPGDNYGTRAQQWSRSEPWPFQHVNASTNNRVAASRQSDTEYSTSTTVRDFRVWWGTLGRDEDRLRTPNQSDDTYWRYACFAIELEGKYLLYSWSTIESDLGDENVWLPVGDSIHVVTVPFNQAGTWTIYDTTASPSPTTTTYDPSTETPLPWRQWKDTSTALDNTRKAELDARKQHIADVISYTQSTAAATPQPLSTSDQSAADTAKQTATDYVNYVSQGS